MAFELHYKGKSYSGGTFASLAHETVSANTVAQFLSTWFEKGTFTFRTSGSTGTPRPFQFRRQQLEAGAQATIRALQLRPHEEHIALCVDPAFVGGAMM